MSFHLDFSEQSKKDIAYHKKSGNKAVLKKLLSLLQELSETPYEGTGKPEALKHNLSGIWSLRINKEHRLLYQVSVDIVFILSAKDHY